MVRKWRCWTQFGIWMTIVFMHQLKNRTSLKCPQRDRFWPIRVFWPISFEYETIKDHKNMPIKDQYADRWKEINEDLNAIKEKKLQRFIGNKKAELLSFCEASSKEYGKTIYLRCQENCQTITNLTRITPLKETSLPRLELLAILVGTRSINFITQSLQLKIDRKTLWTDSQCVLHWLKSKKILTPFVQRRIDEIQSNKGVEFRYVSTTQNPVDIASRGCTVKIRNGNEFWWHGPTWLKKYHDNWPTWNVNIDSSITQEQRKSEEIGLMMKNSSKKRKQWTCMYSLKQESVS